VKENRPGLRRARAGEGSEAHRRRSRDPFERGSRGTPTPTCWSTRVRRAPGAAPLGDIGRHFPGRRSEIQRTPTAARSCARSAGRSAKPDSRSPTSTPPSSRRPRRWRCTFDDGREFAADLEIRPDQVKRQGEDRERLGAIGRGEGIAAERSRCSIESCSVRLFFALWPTTRCVHGSSAGRASSTRCAAAGLRGLRIWHVTLAFPAASRRRASRRSNVRGRGCAARRFSRPPTGRATGSTTASLGRRLDVPPGLEAFVEELRGAPCPLARRLRCQGLRLARHALCATPASRKRCRAGSDFLKVDGFFAGAAVTLPRGSRYEIRRF